MNETSKRYPPIETDIDTPHGRLYRPLNQWAQIGLLFAVFAGAPAVGWLVGKIPGDLSENARTFIEVPFIAVFFFGYALWIARLNAIAFDAIGKSILKALFLFIVRRRKPKSAEEFIPSREKLLEMAVRAQRAGASFAPVSWPIAVLAGLGATLFDTAWGVGARFALLAVPVIAWGYLLAYLGRRGFLPFMEEN